MSGIETKPPIHGRVFAVVAATLAFLTTLQGTPGSVGVALLGASTVSLGILAGSRVALEAGTGLLFLGVVLAAAFMAEPAVPLLGAVATVVAWDVGDNGIGLGRQLGTAAPTRRLEIVHAAASIAVGTTAIVVSYAVYVLAAGNQPLPALVLLLFAAVVLTATLRD